MGWEIEPKIPWKVYKGESYGKTAYSLWDDKGNQYLCNKDGVIIRRLWI